MSEYNVLTDEEISPPEYNHVLKDGWIWNWFSGYLIPPEIDEEEVDTIPAEFLKDNTEIDRLVIQDGIKYIEDEAFAGMSNLVSVMFSDTIKKIGVSAFEGCTSLESISIPPECYSIGENAFANCSSLKSIDMESLNKYLILPKGCFQNTAIEKLVINGGIYQIYEDAFANCHNLTTVFIRSGLFYRLQELDVRAFNGCENLKKVVGTNHLKYFTGIEEDTDLSYVITTGGSLPSPLKEIYQSKLDSKVELLKEAIDEYTQIKDTEDDTKDKKKETVISLRNDVQEYTILNQTTGINLDHARSTYLKSIQALSDETEKDIIQITPATLEMLMTSNMYKVNDRVADMYNSYHALLYN